jgi:signal transduction histidine kinase
MGSPGPLFITAAFMVCAAFLLLLSGREVIARSSSSVTVLTAQLDAAAFAVALLLGVLCLVRWRLVGEAAVLWLGTATVVYGLFTLGLGYIHAISDATENAGLLWMHPASRLVVVALIVLALHAPEVDATLRPARIVAGALGTIMCLTVGFQLFPGLGYELTPSADTPLLGGETNPTASAAFVLIWTGIGVRSLWLGLRGRLILGWFGLLFVSLAFGEVVALASATGTVWGAGPAGLRLLGLLCAVFGATAELSRAYVQQGSRLMASVTSERTAEARITAELATQAERAHEARNALSAIEGATRTLERYQDQLDPGSRTELAAAVSAEVHRLQQLVTASPTPPTGGRFRLTEAFTAVITCARWEGAAIRVDVPDHLVAIGQPAETTQVLQNLIQNAQHYAEGGEIRIRGALRGDRVVIQVEDDGPGVPVEERESIFTRGVRGSTSVEHPGSGLGLAICTRLMHQQDGSIWLEESLSGGASFVISLPGFSELAADAGLSQVTLDQRDERAQFTGETPWPVLHLSRYRKRRARRIEHEDGVSDVVAR